MLTMTAEPQTIATRLRTLREERNLSQRALADAAGISLSILTNIEQEITKDPRVKTLLALANALGVTLNDIAGESKE